ncbi:MAG: hypothetical protein CMH04_03925 [Marinovum sp.]|nr:hypothetical protein [Marinovum sp.]|tara:strand:- start:970 stop:1329 length:360 start_codon:yes stop_codon:yes gene_type:complete
MKYLIIALASLLIPLNTLAEQNNVDIPLLFWATKPVQCAHPDEIIKIPEAYGEDPMITGTGLATMPNGVGMEVQIVLGVNTKTGTWTLIEINGPEQACVLGSGKDITLIKPNNSNKIGT